jgi:hypothetical protein
MLEFSNKKKGPLKIVHFSYRGTLKIYEKLLEDQEGFFV